jgi:4-diphosphocytidyl-2C-methyl-D-erythritol kinase
VLIGVCEERVSAAASYEAFDQLKEVGDSSTAIHHNDLERAAVEIVPGLRERVKAMRETAGVAFVSGSGPAVVGVLETESEAKAAAERVKPMFAEVLVAQPIDWGVRLVLGAESGQ